MASFLKSSPFLNSSPTFINEDEQLWYRYNLSASVALAIAYGLVFIVGLIGNLLVIIAVFSDRQHSVTNIFLANLAVADLLVIIACLPFTLVTNLIYRKLFLLLSSSALISLKEICFLLLLAWVLGAAVCKLLPFLQGVSVYASVYSLVAVAVERCRSITSPFKQRINIRSCRLIIVLIWIVAILITAPWLFVFQQHSVNDDNFLVQNATVQHKKSKQNHKYYFFLIVLLIQFCIEMWPKQWMEVIYFFVAHFLFCYAIPLSIIVVSYAVVGHRIWRRRIPGFQLSDKVQTRMVKLQKSKFRALRMVGVVVLAFAVFWLPFYITFARIQLANVFDQWKLSDESERQLLPIVIPIAQWMSSANSCINPFLYHFLDSRFRYRFRQTLISTN